MNSEIGSAIINLIYRTIKKNCRKLLYENALKERGHKPVMEYKTTERLKSEHENQHWKSISKFGQQAFP